MNGIWRYPADLLRNLLLGARAAVLWRVPLERVATGSLQISGALALNLLPWFVAQRVDIGAAGEFTPAGLPGIWFPFAAFVVVVAVATRLLRCEAWAASLVVVLLNVNIAIDAVIAALPFVVPVQDTVFGDYLGDIAGYWLALALAALLVRLCGWRDWRGGLVAIAGGVALGAAINNIWQTTTLWQEPFDVGRYESDLTRVAARLDEEFLYSQPRLLDQQLQRLQPGRPGRTDLYFLGVAGDSAQKVFLREIRSIYQIMLGRFADRERSLLLVNHAETLRFEPVASVTSIRAAVQRFAEVMQRDEDILFIYLTSHGSQEDGIALSLPPLQLQQLQPATLRKILDDAGIRWRVAVVSACHSGVFVEPLADDHTLVITAAAADRASFGCADENDYTYFGRAYFEDALAESGSFIDAFARARELVAERERAAGETPSLPQISVGREIAAKLKTLPEKTRK